MWFCVKKNSLLLKLNSLYFVFFNDLMVLSLYEVSSEI